MGTLPDIQFIELPNGGGDFSMDTWSFETVRLPHGNGFTNAFRFGSFVYATDFKGMSAAIIERWQGKIHTMIATGLRFKSHKTHNTIEETLELFEALQVKRGILTHMSHEVDFAETSKRLPKHVELAYDGLELAVPPSSSH
jgi:phosphoribosyl 1,2-cyclic phosphate phosphodiesterase